MAGEIIKAVNGFEVASMEDVATKTHVSYGNGEYRITLASGERTLSLRRASTDTTLKELSERAERAGLLDIGDRILAIDGLIVMDDDEPLPSSRPWARQPMELTVASGTSPASGHLSRLQAMCAQALAAPAVCNNCKLESPGELQCL